MYASKDEIIFPGDVFINILFGLKYDEKIKDKGIRKLIAARVISYCHFYLGIICAVIVFLAGFLTFGLAWNKAIRKFVLFGPIDPESSTKERTQGEDKKEFDDIKKEIEMSNAEMKKEMEVILEKLAI